MTEPSSELSRKTDQINDLSRKLSDELSKFTYFILAVSGGAIAYALKVVEGKTEPWVVFSIFASILCWAASFFYGIENLRNYKRHLSVNAECILHSFDGNRIIKELEPYERGAERANRYQLIFLVVGSLAYATSQVVAVAFTLWRCEA